MRTLIIVFIMCAVSTACSSHKDVSISRQVVTDSVAAHSLASERFLLDSVLNIHDFEFESLDFVSFDPAAGDSVCLPNGDSSLKNGRVALLSIKGGKSVKRSSAVSAESSGLFVCDSTASGKRSLSSDNSVSEVTGIYEPPDLSAIFIIVAIVAVAIFLILKSHK